MKCLSEETRRQVLVAHIDGVTPYEPPAKPMATRWWLLLLVGAYLAGVVTVAGRI